MFNNGKIFNPYYNQSLSGEPWARGYGLIITTAELDAINAAYKIWGEEKGRNESEIFRSALERQRVIAEQGESERLAKISFALTQNNSSRTIFPVSGSGRTIVPIPIVAPAAWTVSANEAVSRGPLTEIHTLNDVYRVLNTLISDLQTVGILPRQQ